MRKGHEEPKQGRGAEASLPTYYGRREPDQETLQCEPKPPHTLHTIGLLPQLTVNDRKPRLSHNQVKVGGMFSRHYLALMSPYVAVHMRVAILGKAPSSVALVPALGMQSVTTCALGSSPTTISAPKSINGMPDKEYANRWRSTYFIM